MMIVILHKSIDEYAYVQPSSCMLINPSIMYMYN